MFIDIAKIKIVSGKGGDGKVGFHREKYVAAGGPDGGDGGRGGSVIFKVDDNLSTLLDFRYKKKYVAAPGEPGGGKRCKGKDGADLIIRVPRGTIIRDQKTGQVMKDMSDSEPFVAAKGGNGGWGNTHFATPTRQAPRFAKPGLPGVERDIILELKLLADVGLVGFPNVGKSTLLSMVSAARPKIANYHFTTLVPNLGVVSVGEEQNFVMADIPGISRARARVPVWATTSCATLIAADCCCIWLTRQAVRAATRSTTLRRSTPSLPATASFWQRVRRSLLPTRPTCWAMTASRLRRSASTQRSAASCLRSCPQRPTRASRS